MAKEKLPPGRRGEVIDDLYFEEDERRAYLWRFGVLMFLSIVIAAYGIASDSAPVVIGAMLVAPLMTPLLGTAAALVMGWPWRQLSSILIVAFGSAGAVAVAFAATAVLPDPDAVRSSSELLSRTSPSMLDLVIALAAGAAGAYVLVHREITAALPGAAIAVALIPPLAVIGISLELGEPRLAEGATLLYLVNLTAIVFAAAFVFVLTGFVPHRDGSRFSRRTRVGLAIAAIAIAAVAYPLVKVSQRAVQDALDEATVRDLTQAWVSGTDIDVVAAEVDDDRVSVEVVGSERPPPIEKLESELEGELERELQVSAEWVRALDLGAPVPPDFQREFPLPLSPDAGIGG